MASRESIRGLTVLLFAALTVGTTVAVPVAIANVDDGRARMENLSRQVVGDRYAQEDEASPASVNMFSGRTWQRVKHASWSLLIPGWSHYRAKQYGRAALFAGAEAAIWISYGVFKTQASRREDAYKEFAMQFAGVRSKDHPEKYWRSVGQYVSNEDYNEVVRRDLRAGVDPEGPEYFFPDDWLWRSEMRLDEYQQLRREGNDADHRADLTITWAIVNRVISFVDAMRAAPVARENPLGLPPEGFSIDLDLDPSLQNPSTTLVLRQSF